jgi:ferritin
VYGLASKFLTILQDELEKKHQFIKVHKDKIVSKKMSIHSFMKKTQNSPHLKQLEDVEKTLDACLNIRRLCGEAYDLGKNIRENKLSKDYEISEELDDFIRLTNEHTPCYTKEDYEKYKMLMKN